MRNYFNIVRSVGLIFFGIGTFFVSVTLPEFMERLGSVGETNSFYSDNVWEDGLAAIMLLGFTYLIAGLAGILKAKWFPKMGVLVLVLSFIGFNWFFIIEVIPDTNRGEEYFYATGLLLMVYSLITCFMFLMYNQYFLDALHGEDDKEEKDERILDA